MAGSFLKTLFSFLVPAKDTDEAVKKRQLSLVKSDLKRSRHRSWYRTWKQKLTIDAGNFFYELYRISNRAAGIMENADESEQLKIRAVEFHMSDALLGMKERLSPETIATYAANLENDHLRERVEIDINKFNASFDQAFVQRADLYYNLLLLFAQFATFDFVSLLKQFDPLMSDHSTLFRPKFRMISAKKVIELIKDFLEVTYPLEKSQDWETMFELATKYKEQTGMTLEEWKQVLSKLAIIQGSSILVLIVRHVEQNPLWKSLSRTKNRQITNDYRAAVVGTAKKRLDEIIQGREQKQLTELLAVIFGPGEAENRMRFYTAEEDAALRKNELEGYLYVQELNCVKAFILDFYKKDIRELFDMCVLRGHWAKPEDNRELADRFHAVLTLFEELMAFDDSLAEDGLLGSKLYTALVKTKSLAPGLIAAINGSAKDLLARLTQAIIDMESRMKLLCEDQAAKANQIIQNWDALEVAGTSLTDRCFSIQKKLNGFAKVLQLFQHRIQNPPQT
jgi:hypothetical protein